MWQRVAVLLCRAVSQQVGGSVERGISSYESVAGLLLHVQGWGEVPAREGDLSVYRCCSQALEL